MATQPIENLLAKSRENWGPSAHELTEARKLDNLTKPELAQRTGINQGDISRIEHGLGDSTPDTFMKLAYALGMRLVLQSLEARQKPEK